MSICLSASRSFSGSNRFTNAGPQTSITLSTSYWSVCATSSAVSFSRMLAKGTYWYLTLMPLRASKSASLASWALNCGATTVSTLTVLPA